MSKFDKIFKARETGTTESKKSDNKEPFTKKNALTRKDDNKVKQIAEVIPEPLPASSSQIVARRGRPAAKRSDPDFVGLTTYIRRETHTRAKIALLQEGKGKELSELVEDLIYNWLNSK